MTPKGLGSFGGSKMFITPSVTEGDNSLLGVTNLLIDVKNQVGDMNHLVTGLRKEVSEVQHITGTVQTEIRTRQQSLESKLESLELNISKQFMVLAEYVEMRMDRIESNTILGLLKRLKRKLKFWL